MPVILRQKTDGKIFSCILKNIYDLDYYGTRYWDDPKRADAEYADFLQQMNEDIGKWELVEIEEHQLKMCNVKLANDPRRSVYLDQKGHLTVR
ncbi:MAG TPA: hypothetical protein VF260_08615 [Bacilli bacterium]